MLRGEQQSGLTLIELMVVLAITAIIITLSTPLSDLLQQNRISSQVREFAGALNLARGSAVSGGTCASLCIWDGNNPADCRAPTNDDDQESWDAGWLVFSDTNCNAAIDAGDVILKQFAALPDGFSLRVQSTNNNAGGSNDNRETITYQPSGIARNSVGTWTLCDPSGNVNFKRGIDISVTGRVQSLTDDEANGQGIVLANCPP